MFCRNKPCLLFCCTCNFLNWIWTNTDLFTWLNSDGLSVLFMEENFQSGLNLILILKGFVRLIRVSLWLWGHGEDSRVNLKCLRLVSVSWSQLCHNEVSVRWQYPHLTGISFSGAFLFSFECLWSPLSVISVSSPMWYQ